MKDKKTQRFGIQRKIVANMTTESWKTVPHAVYSYEPDVTRFIKIRKRLGNMVSLNTLLLKAISEGLKVAPLMNAHIRYNPWLVRGEVQPYAAIDISMPSRLPNGEMMTLTVPDVGNKNLLELQVCIDDLMRRAESSDLTEAMMETAMADTLRNLPRQPVKALGRVWGAKVGPGRIQSLSGKKKQSYRALPSTQRLTAQDIRQGTVTVSNIGSLYPQARGRMTLLEIIPPQTVAIGIGSLQRTPGLRLDGDGWPITEQRWILPICIAFDHRVIDFGDIVPFLRHMDSIFDKPEEISEW